MRPFNFELIERAEDLASTGQGPGAGRLYIAGGTTVIDLMKLDVMRPEVLVDINGLSTDPQFGEIAVDDNSIRIGGLVKMSEAIEHPEIRSSFPVLVESLELAASQQLRNMASLAGNVLQRTRCGYYRDTSWSACNKRTPGSGCSAMQGFNRIHAVLGTSDACIATYPGDFAQALMTLEAQLEVVSGGNTRTMPFADLHQSPGDRPDVETKLQPGDLIKAIIIPRQPWGRRSTYVKVRDRDSYEFALASAAVALDMDGEKVRQARIALGGVATVPWRSTAAEQKLTGQLLTEATAMAAAEEAFRGAVVHEHNAYKVPLGKATLVRALLQAQSMEI